MPLLAPYHSPLAPEQVQRRLFWLGLDDLSSNDQVRMLATDRILYHYTSYLLVCDKLTRSALHERLHTHEPHIPLFYWLKSLIKESVESVSLKQLTLHDTHAWHVALLHHTAHALGQSHRPQYDLPFDTAPIHQWQLRFIHAQPCTNLWGSKADRLLWLEEVEGELSHWPATFTEEEHPSNGDKTRLGYEQAFPYHYLTAREVLSEVRALLHEQRSEALETPLFIRLYNRVTRLSGAYAARPLANAGLFPPEASWDILQQHRPFALRARHWLQDPMTLPLCTRLLLNKHYTQADRPHFHWGQHDRKRYLEAMQRSINTFLLH